MVRCFVNVLWNALIRRFISGSISSSSIYCMSFVKFHSKFTATGDVGELIIRVVPPNTSADSYEFM